MLGRIHSGPFPYDDDDDDDGDEKSNASKKSSMGNIFCETDTLNERSLTTYTYIICIAINARASGTLSFNPRANRYCASRPT